MSRSDPSPSSGSLSLRPSFWPRPPSSDPVKEKAYRRSAWGDAWNARGATFVVHLLTLALAAWPAAAWHATVTRAAGPAPVEQGVLLDLLRESDTVGLGGALLAFVFAGGLALLLSIPLQLGWIAALAGRERRECLELAARRWGRALAVTLIIGVVAALAFALACLPAYFLHTGYRSEPNARTHDLLVLAALLVPLLVLLTAAAWLDLARAASLRQGVGESLKRGWWSLKGASGTYTWVTLARAALGLPLMMLPLPPVALLIVLQLSALLSTFLRSRWLAEAWRHVAAKVAEIPSDS